MKTVFMLFITFILSYLALSFLFATDQIIDIANNIQNVDPEAKKALISSATEFRFLVSAGISTFLAFLSKKF